MSPILAIPFGMAIEQSSTMLVQSSQRQELAERIARAQPREGETEPRPGLHLYRRSVPGERFYGLAQPAFCVIAQGSKRVMLGGHRFRYDPAQYLITTMALPLVAEVVDATAARPYL